MHVFNFSFEVLLVQQKQETSPKRKNFQLAEDGWIVGLMGEEVWECSGGEREHGEFLD